MKNKPKPDNRSDNVERIQRNINHTIQNIELANEAIDMAGSDKTKEELEGKNKRRERALEGMCHEIKDEAQDRDKGLS
jgi:small acid-soluble spore protein (thioredoxin-like protein)